MSKKAKKSRQDEEKSCFVCGKTPAFYQKGYMGGKYLCQTHAVRHLKFTRLLMVTAIIVACIFMFNNFNSKAENSSKKETKTSKTKKVHQKTKVIKSINKN